MESLKCENCWYWWKAKFDERRRCHWESRAPDDLPPCEEEERAIELRSWEDECYDDGDDI